MHALSLLLLLATAGDDPGAPRIEGIVPGPRKLADPEPDSPDVGEGVLRVPSIPEDPVPFRWPVRSVEAGVAGSDAFEGPHDTFTGFFETHFSSQAWRRYVWDDYLTQPAVLIPIGIGTAAAIVSHWDKQLERNLRGTMGGHQTIGNITMYSLVGGALLLGTVFPGSGRNSWDELFTQGESFGATALTTFALKESVRRPRPFSGGGAVHSFPSGHTSGAFCAATLIERNFGDVAAIPAYALAALTGYSRVDSARHYPSDVLAGAAIGILSARIFDGLHWGIDGKGGIARPPAELCVEIDGRGSVIAQFRLGF